MQRALTRDKRSSEPRVKPETMGICTVGVRIYSCTWKEHTAVSRDPPPPSPAEPTFGVGIVRSGPLGYAIAKLADIVSECIEDVLIVES